MAKSSRKKGNSRTGSQSSLANAINNAAQAIQRASNQGAGQTRRTYYSNGNRNRDMHHKQGRTAHERRNYYLETVEKQRKKNKSFFGSDGDKAEQRRTTQDNNFKGRDKIVGGKVKRELYDPDKKKSVNKIGELTKGGIEQSVGSIRKAFAGPFTGDEKSGSKGYATGMAAHRAGLIRKPQKGSNDRRSEAEKIKSKEIDKKIEQYKENLGKTQIAGANEESKNASKQIERGTNRINKAQEGMNKGQKWLSDAYVAGLQLGGDIAVGAATGGTTLPVMFVRSYGSAMDTAEKEGATKKQAMAYGVGVGALETATEKISAVTKPFTKFYGKGLADDLTEKVVSKMAGKAASKTGKDMLYHGGKTFATAIGEGLEEMVSEGLEPAIANKIYADSVGNPHSTSVKDILYAGSIGAALGGILGGGGQIAEYSQGKNITDDSDRLYSLIERGKDADEESDTYMHAYTVEHMMKTGQGVTAGQAVKLQRAVAQQEYQDYDNFGRMVNVSEDMAREEGYAMPFAVSGDGEVGFAPATYARFDKIYKAVVESYQNADVGSVANAVAKIATGTGSIEDIYLMQTRNPEARKIYEEITGETLPATNIETKSYLTQKIGENFLAMAEEETLFQSEVQKGQVMRAVGNELDPAGQAAFETVLSDYEGKDVMQASDAFKFYYDAGNVGMKFDETAALRNPVEQALPENLRKLAFAAGATDRSARKELTQSAREELGRAVKENRHVKAPQRKNGKLKIDVDGGIKASHTKLFRQLAYQTGVDIVISDKLGENVNGYYKNGVIHLSVNADRPLEFVWGHEITHHIEDAAPEQYAALEDFILNKWIGNGASEAIDNKIAQYKDAGHAITREGAIREIIADSTYEILQNEAAINQLVNEDKTLARAILDAIKKLIASIKNITDGQFTPAQNTNLLKDLGILEDAAKMWTNALYIAFESNQIKSTDNVSTTDKEEDIRHSLADTDYLNAVNSGDMETAQRMVDEAATAAMSNTKIVDEDGNLMRVYHGTEEQFTVFDSTKARANMDIQGNFFSPWEIDAQGYGNNIQSYYLNIENPASESIGYKALNKYAGQNNAGVKARELLERMGYDGVNNENEEYIAFYSNQIKSADPVTYNDNGEVIPLSERFNEEKQDIRYSLKNIDITYDSLAKKPDMKIAKVTTALDDIMNLKRKDIAKEAKSRLENKVGLDSKNRTVVHNSDTDSDIVVGKPGIEHGLDRNYQDTAIVSMHLDEYLSEAIKINEVFPDTNRKHYSDVLLGYGENKFGEKIPAYFVISKLKTGKDELIEFGSLYSVRGKKIEDDSAQGSPGIQSRTSSIISISNLLDIVNEMYSDILPKSVAEHYRIEQKKSKLGDSTKYSVKDMVQKDAELRDKAEQLGRSMKESFNSDMETEFHKMPPRTAQQAQSTRVRNKSYEELQKQCEYLQQQMKKTGGKMADMQDLRKRCNLIIRTLMGGTTNNKMVQATAANCSKMFTAIKTGDFPTAVTIAEEAARDMVENLTFRDETMFNEYKDLRDYLRLTPISISKENRWTDFNDFRTANFGRIKITNSGIPVDEVYAELRELFPGMFGDAVNPEDQMREIADVRESLEPVDYVLNEEETLQLEKQIANDLLEIAATGKTLVTWADKQNQIYEGKLESYNKRAKEALKKSKDRENERRKDYKEKQRAKRKEAVSKERIKREKALKALKEKHAQRLSEQKRKSERKRYVGSIKKNHAWLSDRLIKPTDDKHIPEGFRQAVANLLQQFGFQTELSKKLEEKYGKAQKTIHMEDLRRKYAELAKEDGSGMFEYDGYIFELMDSLAIKLEGKSIDKATNADLVQINTLLKSIVNNVRMYNKAFQEEIQETISELGNATIAKANAKVKKKGKNKERSGAMGGIGAILNESMVSSRDKFEELGGGIQIAYLGMRRGFDRHIDNVTHTREFFKSVFGKYNKKGKPGSKIESWRDNSHAIEYTTEQGQKIKLSPSQIMSLYCLNKREQAQGHILGSGIVASRIDNASKIKKALGAKIEYQSETVSVTANDIISMISTLSEEQISIADKLMDYLNNECADWGNEVSMKLYGYKKFTEKNYFPIKSADAFLDSNFEARQPVERIKNFGFTKGTVVNANNPIMIADIFEVISGHVNKMSLYNAFAAPISDFTRVYNYKSRDASGFINGSVKASIEDAYGKRAINYINSFVADVNNTTQIRTEGVTRFVAKSLANYKKATIGGNFRVALQQPTAIIRALAVIDPKYFVNSNINPKRNLKDMKDHCQIARWKSWGHSQVDMARDIDDIMMNNEWTKIDVVTMQIYGSLDNLTWSVIWAAVRKEVTAKNHDVEVNSDRFYELCNERASEIFDKTQVVDSVFHKSQVMRNTDTMSKMVTSFMAEPTRTYNMLRTDIVRARELWNEGNKKEATAKMSRVLSVFVLNAAAVSAAAAIADLLRNKQPDDDDEKEGIDLWWANLINNFIDNVNPLNMIPVVKDWGFKDGWGSSNMALEGYESLMNSVSAWAKYASGESDKTTAELARDTASSIGLVTGIPIKNALREVESAFKLFGIDVFAAEADEDKGIYETQKDSFIDKILNYFGADKSDADKEKEARDDRVEDIQNKIKGLTGRERQEAIWKETTTNYTNYIADGEFETLREMRKTLGMMGGDVEKFDESVQSKVKTAMKKNIGENSTAVLNYRNFLWYEYGMTDGKINQEVVMKSDTANEFQLAAVADDYDAMVDTISKLYSAGLTEGELDILYANRAKAIQATDFSTGELLLPVSGDISSGFGYRDSPGGIGSTNHMGIDIAVAANTDVAVADGGKVSYVGYTSTKGYYVTVSHGSGRYTEYYHLNDYYVQKGDAVSKGQTIALSGSTGNSTGPHLHFAVRENGTYVDPMNYFR